MASPIRPQAWSWPEFVVYADTLSDRCEFIDRQPVLQAPGTRDHAQAVMGSATALRVVLEGSGYSVVTGGPWLRIGEDRFLPDVMVLPPGIPENQTDREVTQAEIVVEVLSGSSELRDRGRKWVAYRRLPSLQTYLLVDTVNRQVEIFSQRDGVWTVEFYYDHERVPLMRPVPTRVPAHYFLGQTA